MVLQDLKFEGVFGDLYMGNFGLGANLKRQENRFDRTQDCFCASNYLVNEYERSIAQADAILMLF